MSVRFLILATLLITIVRALVSVGTFFVALPLWTDMVLSRHLSAYVGKLQFVVSDEYIGWPLRRIGLIFNTRRIASYLTSR